MLSISIIHCIISTVSWRRSSAELFVEYAPLVKLQASFYKYIAAVLAVVLFFSTALINICRFSHPTFMKRVATISGMIAHITSI